MAVNTTFSGCNNRMCNRAKVVLSAGFACRFACNFSLTRESNFRRVGIEERS